MGIDFSKWFSSAPPLDHEQLLRRAQAGDAQAREKLIQSNMSHIVRIASRLSRRYLEAGRDDEVSIALMAFNEAIDSYQADRGASFHGFAETVIRRRLVDFFRREGKRPEIPLSELESEDEEGSSFNYAEVKGSLEHFESEQSDDARRKEIVQYTHLLASYGIQISELVRIAPKHRDARQRAMFVARLIAETDVYRRYLVEKQSLPLLMLEKDHRVQISRKTLERQRKYIIAVAVLYMSDLYYLKDYIQLELDDSSSPGRGIV